MTETMSQWLKGSHEALANMQRELAAHEAAVEAAMATIRSHGEEVERLERSIEIIGRAVVQAESSLQSVSPEPQPQQRTAPASLFPQQPATAHRSHPYPGAPALRAVPQR